MNTKTSFFNKRIFLNNLWRNLPFVLIMTAILAIDGLTRITGILSAFEYNSWTHADQMIILQNELLSEYCTSIIKLLLTGYSLYAGITVFHYLFNKKLCGTMHSMPLTRGCLYITNVLSGLTLIVLPIVLNSLILAIDLVANGYSCKYLPLMTIVLIGYCLIFYALAILSVMLTGHLLAAPVMYGALNFGYMISKVIIQSFATSFLFGFTTSVAADSYLLTPFVRLYNILHVVPYDNESTPGSVADTIQYRSGVNKTLWFYAAACLVILIICFFLYKRRSLETQGDPITSKKLQPFILYLGTLVGGAAATTILYGSLFSFSSCGTDKDFAFIVAAFVITSVIIHYALTMILRKTIHVFRGNFKGIIVYTCLALMSFLLIRLDALGIISKQPDVKDVASVQMYSNYTGVCVQEPENIETILAQHRDILDNKDALIESMSQYGNNTPYDFITLTYHLKNGKTLVRQYPIISLTTELPDDLANVCNTLLSDINAIYNSPSVAVDNLTVLDQNNTEKHIEVGIPECDSDGYVYPVLDVLSKEMYQPVMNALKQDAKDGKLTQQLHNDGYSMDSYLLNFYINIGDDYYSCYNVEYAISEDCKTFELIDQWHAQTEGITEE